MEVEGWLIPLLCPHSTFSFGWIDFGGIRPEEKDDHPWHLLPRSAPKGSRFDFHFFFVGVLLWARLDEFLVLEDESGV